VTQLTVNPAESHVFIFSKDEFHALNVGSLLRAYENPFT